MNLFFGGDSKRNILQHKWKRWSVPHAIVNEFYTAVLRPFRTEIENDFAVCLFSCFRLDAIEDLCLK